MSKDDAIRAVIENRARGQRRRPNQSSPNRVPR